MSGEARADIPIMGSILRKLVKWLVSLAAAAVILLALLVGVARLLLPLVPEYHDDIRRWSSEATGFDVAFQRISASWPLSGPELHFYDVRVTSPVDGAPVLDAEEFGVGISVMQLIVERKPTLRRVFIKKARVELERTDDGRLRIQGRMLDEFLDRWGTAQRASLPDVDLALHDIDVTFTDQSRGGESLGLSIDQLEVDLSSSGVALAGELELSTSLGRDLEISMDVPAEVLFGATRPEEELPDWDIYLSAGELDMAALLESWAGLDEAVPSATGSLILWVRMSGMQPLSVTADLNLDELQFDAGRGAIEQYDSLSGRFEWSVADGGWLAGATELRIGRAGRISRQSDFRLQMTDPEDGRRLITASSGFIQLQDIYPFARVIAKYQSPQTQLPHDVSGELRDLEIHFRAAPESPPVFDVRAEFRNAGVVMEQGGIEVSGIAGMIVADQRGGRLNINSRRSHFTVPRVFMAPVRADSIDGLFVWHTSRGGVRLLSDNVDITAPGVHLQSRLEVDFPSDDGVPFVDLHAVGSSPDAGQVLQYLPLRRFSAGVRNWLNRAIVGGRITRADIELRGPITGFPYADGQGVFRAALQAENAQLHYAPGWPHVRGAKATVIFDGPGVSTIRNHGHIAGLEFRNADISIENLKKAVLRVSGSQPVQFEKVLDFLRASPLASNFGPKLAEVHASGQLDTRLELTLPLKPGELKNYRLNIEARLGQNDISLEGIETNVTGISGTAKLNNTRLSADNLSGVLMGQPVEISIEPAAEADEHYGQVVHIRGTTPLPTISRALKLPLPNQLTGDMTWNLAAFMPRYRKEATAPLRILVNSNLNGVTSTLPVPMAKAAGDTEHLDLEVLMSTAGTDTGAVNIFGRLQRGTNWAIRLVPGDNGYRMDRAAVHMGDAPAVLPETPSVRLSGQFDTLRLTDWLELDTGGKPGSWRKLPANLDLSVRNFAVFGMIFRDMALVAEQKRGAWQVDVDGPGALGRIFLPKVASDDNPVGLDMQRLWLMEPDTASERIADPRGILPMTIAIEDFRIGTLNFGALKMNTVRVPHGIAAESIDVAGSGFVIKGNGDWLVDAAQPDQQRSRLNYRLDSTDIEATLIALGYDPVIKSNKGYAAADINWPGAPDDTFLQRASGSFSVKLEQGRVISLEPGGGRLLGLLSIAALPRRLAMDFSDVFKEGLSFDTLSADFRLEDGNAYTCNLDLEGNVAALGVIGRAGLRTRDYEQLAVVRPHVSNVFALGGVVLGGPGVGAAAFLISQIFRKPLSSLGESYYQISGSWDNPDVTRIQRTQLDTKRFRECEQYLLELAPPQQDEVTDMPTPEG